MNHAVEKLRRDLAEFLDANTVAMIEPTDRWEMPTIAGWAVVVVTDDAGSDGYAISVLTPINSLPTTTAGVLWSGLQRTRQVICGEGE